MKHIDTEMIKKGGTFVIEMRGICFLSETINYQLH